MKHIDFLRYSVINFTISDMTEHAMYAVQCHILRVKISALALFLT